MIDPTKSPASPQRPDRPTRGRHPSLPPAPLGVAVAVLTAMVVLVATVSPSASALGPVLRSTEIDLGDVLAATTGRPSGWQPPAGTTPAGDEVEPVVLIPGFGSDGLVHRYRLDGSSDGELTSGGDGLQRARAVAVGGDGLVYVADAAGDQVLRYDPVDSSLVDVFVAAGSGGLSQPRGLAVGPDGNLVVASAGSGQLLEYDGRTGEPIGVVADGLHNPGGLVFSQDGHLIATSQNDDAVHIYVDGQLHRTVDVGPGAGPVDVAIDPAGVVVVALADGGRVDRIDLEALAGERADAAIKVEPLVTSGLVSPTSVAFGPDGELWVADQWTDQVRRVDRDTGELVDTIIDSDTAFGPSDLAFYPDSSAGPDRTPGNGTPAGRSAGLSAAEWLARQSPPGGRGRGGLRFEANDGRADPDLDFVARGRDYGVVLAGADAVVSPDGTGADAIRLDFVDAAEDPAPETFTSEATASVLYDDVYPGVDVTYRDNSGDLEYLLTIEPGADPDVVSFELANATDLELTGSGSLLIWVPSGGAMELTAPVAYQEHNGTSVDVASSFDLRADGTVGFAVGSYDPALALIIDPTFRASTSADSGGGNTITIARPAGVTIDDVLLASIAQPKDGAVTPPAGWTLIRSDAVTGKIQQDLFYKVATGSEPASYVFNLAIAGKSAGAMVAYDGVDTSNPIDAHGGQGNASSTSYTAPSITTTTSGATLVAFFGNGKASATTPPAGMTERADHASDGGATEIADEELVSAGSTGTRVATGAASENVGQLVALTPDDPAAGSIGRWRLDEGSGTTATDSSGGGHDGTITGATYTAGVSSTGLDFTGGSGERVVVGDPVDGSLDPGTGDWSVSAWFRTTVKPGSSEFDQLVYKSDGSEGYELFLVDGGASPRLTFRIRDGGSSWTVLHVAPVDDGEWHHAAGVMDGSNLYLYLDGTLVDTQAHSATDVDTIEQLAFGAEEDGLAWSDYEGDLDEISIYDRALTAGEITELAGASTVTVNSTGDASDNNQGDGLCDTGGTVGSNPECTLRAAIQEANAAATIDTIHFDIPDALVGGTHLIAPGSNLPTISDPVTIDAATEPDFASTPIVTLSGQSAGFFTTGLTLGAGADGSTIRGLVIRDFDFDGIEVEPGNDGSTIAGNYIGRLDITGGDSGAGTENGNAGIWGRGSYTLIGGPSSADRNVISGNGTAGISFSGAATGNVVIGNHIGTDAAGTAMLPNLEQGVYLDATSGGNTIGGTATGEGNLISGNNTSNTATSAGIYVLSSTNTIQGNRIGTDVSGTANLENDGAGITLAGGAANNLIGGTAAGAGNTIAFNKGDGVRLMSDAGNGNAILGNSIHTNEDPGLGIDLRNNAVTLNDGGDADSGTNDLLNFPEITSAVESGGTVTVTFDLDVPANPDQYRVEFFANPSGTDGSGYGEGEIFVSSVITGPGVGLTHNFAGSAGDVITATVTEIDSAAASGYGPTSEFAQAVTVPNSPPTAVSFQQGVDGYSGTVDTWISGNVPNQDNSADVLIQVDNSPLQRGLIRFDGIIGSGPGQIPAGATIVSAELTFEATDPSGADASLYFHRMLRSWVETDTWNSLVSGVSTDDVEASSATDTVHTGGLDLTGTPVIISGLEAAVQAWADGDNNRGWLFTLDRDDGWDPRSSENSVVGGRPRLDVTYVTAPDTVIVNSTGDAADATPGDDVCDTGATNSEGATECTLRAAIEEANASSTIDVIEFNMPATESGHSGGVWTITPGSALPALSTTVGMDGTTQPGWTSTPVVQLDGVSAGGTANGLRVTGDNVEIRSLAIGRFGLRGILVESGAAGTLIAGNHIGLDASGTVDRGNGDRGIELATGSGPTTVGGPVAADRNVISGNVIGGVIIWSSNANTVIGNYIGTDVTGNASLPNDLDGIKLVGTSSNNIIGQPGAGNVMSGNGNDGIELDDDLTGNVIQANIIGLGADGSTLVDNARYGVVIYNGVNNTQIGGTGAGEGNVISNNTSHGIMLDGNANPGTANNTIEGNLIGTDATGLLDRGNGGAGIFFYNGANTTTIGGATAGHRNVISGNTTDGVYLQNAGTADNVIKGNYIGVDATGNTPLPNGDRGVQIESGANNTVVGGTVAGEGNVISGNGNDGIIISDGADPGTGTTGTVIEGNLIGVGADGTTPVGNGTNGVRVTTESNHRIGGTAAGAGNTIAHNGGDGVNLQNASADLNSILGNSIVANSQLGIDLGDNEVTVNDVGGGDADSGANDLLNFPVITSAEESAGTVTVGFDLDVPDGAYRVEFFSNPSGVDGSGYGEGEAFAGSVEVTVTGGVPSPAGTTFAGTAGDEITATATEDLGGGSFGATSEFSAAETVTLAGGTPDWLMLSTPADVGSPSGVSSVDSWSAGALLEFADPSFALGSGGTAGTLSLLADFDLQSDGNVDVVGLHYVESSITVGSSPSVTLQPGDLLFSSGTNETYTNADLSTTDVSTDDVILFRPAVPGDFTSGTFSVLLESPLGGTLNALTLVESDTDLPDVTLTAGTFLLTDGQVVFSLVPTGTGVGNSPGTATVLLDGADTGLDDNLSAIDLVEDGTLIGGASLYAGALLLSMDNDDAAGNNDLVVDRRDVFILTLTATTAGSGTGAGTAEMLFDGSDVGFDNNDEAISGFALVGGTPITAPIAGDDSVRMQRNGVLAIAPLVNDIDPNGDPLAIQSFTQPGNGTVTDNGDGTLTYTPDFAYTGLDNFTYTVTDGTETAVATVYVEVRTPELWVATDDIVVASGTAGLTSWTTGQVLSLGDPGLALDPPTTSATVGEVLDLDRFASDGVAKIGALHEVRTGVTVGSGPTAFDLLPGDLVLVSDASETFYGGTTIVSVSDSDVLVFRPDAPGDPNSSGEFYYLLENPVAAGQAKSLTVVEQPTIVGDTFLTPGTFLFSSSGDPKSLMRYTVDATGFGTTAGTLTLLADLADVGLGGAIEGMDLIERAVTVGGVTLNEGTVLLTTDGETTVAGLSVERWDVFAVDITASSLVAGITSATATMVFDGSDTDFDDNTESLFALSLSGADDLTGGNSAPVAVDDGAGTDQGMPVVIDVVANDTDADTDPLTVIDVVDGADGTVVDNGDGTVTYTGDTAFNGTDVFAYTISDGNGSTDTALVIVTVNAHSLPMAVYRSSGKVEPRYQTWDGAIFGGELVSAAVGEFRTIQGAEAPDRDEAIVIGVNLAGTIAGERWNGSAWTALPALGSTTGSYWALDVAYEAVSGDAMVVYADGADLRYRTWNGSTWSAETSITEPLTGTPRQLQLASHPWADEMVLIVSDDASQDYALVWDGSAWGSAVTVHSGGAGDRTDVYAAYEQQSGQALVVYGKGTEDVFYRSWNGTWSGEAQLVRPGGVAGYARWTTLGSDPSSDRIALGVLTNSADVWLAVWDGAVWVNVTAATTSASGTTHPAVAVAFEGSSGQAIAAYSGLDNTPEYRTWSTGTGWSGQANALDVGAVPNSVMLYPHPLTDEMMLATQDSGADLNYTYWNGTTWTSVYQLSSNTGTTTGQPFLFLWNQRATPPAPSPIVTVNSTGDSADTDAGDNRCDTGGTNSEGDPECTLRAALQEANASSVVDTIEFAIPVSDPGHSGVVWTVSPGTVLPQLTDAVAIDGTTQPGYAGSPVVVLDGTSLGAGDDGLVVAGSADGVTVSGVAVISFPDDGITINGDNTVIRDSYVGLSADGVTPAGNGTEGIVIQSTASATQLVDNVISGQTSAAAVVIGNDSTGTVLTGNLIGTSADGLTTIGNRGGIWSDTTGTARIGGVAASDANTFVGSEFDAITYIGTGTLSVLGNTITGNGGIGFDLGDDGVTTNDILDVDSGANGLLNYPVPAAPASGDTTVAVELDVPPGDYRVEVFVNPTEGADFSGFGEGESLLAAQTVTHTGSGSEPFVIAIPAVFAGEVLTATATEDLGGGSFGATSEFSAAVTVVTDTVGILDASVRRSDLVTEGGLDPASAATTGTAGSALTFDGGDDLLRGPGLDVTESELTVSAWIRPSVFTGTDYVVSKRNGVGDRLYELGVNGVSGQAVGVLTIGGSEITVEGGTVTPGSWHHLAVTWDGATVRLYLNGTEMATAAATGSLATDIATDVIVGNRSDGSAGFSGEIDHVEIAHAALTAAEVAARHSTVADQALTVFAGQQQTAAPGAWTVSGVQSRSGGFALAAPETAESGAAAWAVATGIDEPGTVFETWWWASTAAGVDLGSGTRAGVSPTDQFDAAYVGADTWNLRRRSGSVSSVDGSGTQALSTGSWVKVEQWTDQNGNSRLLVDGVEVAPWTAQTAPPASGSLGLRVGQLPGGQSWYVDDPRARRLVMPEPTSTLGALDRD